MTEDEINKVCDEIDIEDNEFKGLRKSTPYNSRSNCEVGIIREVSIQDLEDVNSDELYFLQENYIKSSPLTPEEKEYLSNSKVGEVDFNKLGDFDFLNDEPDDDNPFENQQ
jgi:hypothetical protein